MLNPIYLQVCTHRSGKYETYSCIPESVSHRVMRYVHFPATGGENSPIEYLSLESNMFAVICSERISGDRDRPSQNCYMAVFDEEAALQLTELPERIFALAKYLRDQYRHCNENPPPLGRWPQEVLSCVEATTVVNESPAASAAVRCVIRDFTGQRTCFEGSLSVEELLQILKTFPPRLRSRICFCYGYCESFANEILQVVVRKEGDPYLFPAPKCSKYTVGNVSPDMESEAHELLCSLPEETLRDLDLSEYNPRDFFRKLSRYRKPHSRSTRARNLENSESATLPHKGGKHVRSSEQIEKTHRTSSAGRKLSAPAPLLSLGKMLGKMLISIINSMLGVLLFSLLFQSHMALPAVLWVSASQLPMLAIGIVLGLLLGVFCLVLVVLLIRRKDP